MSSQSADAVALLYSLLGGFFMGAFPVPIKSPDVLKAAPHPVVFQCYKTFWVFLFSWIFVVARPFEGNEIIFDFTWWGVISAAGWIPSGLATIAAVPRLGVGVAIAVSTGSASVLSFLVFWLVLGESMKEHNIAGHRTFLAPFYLACILLGMAALVVIPTQRAPAGGPRSPLTTDSTGPRDGGAKTFLAGLGFAVTAGFFSAVQYGAVNLGKAAAAHADGCGDDTSKCSDAFKERFNTFGSWEASFGIGALLVTGIYAGGLCGMEKARGSPMPPLHFKVLRIPGSIAGVCWALGNLFQTAAVVRGGNAVMLPANQGVQLVTSGAFGVLYYGEMPNLRRGVLWSIAALWTLAAIILLSEEKAS